MLLLVRGAWLAEHPALVQGNFAPQHRYVHETDLKVIAGEIPKALNGAFVRVG